MTKKWNRTNIAKGIAIALTIFNGMALAVTGGMSIGFIACDADQTTETEARKALLGNILENYGAYLLDNVEYTEDGNANWDLLSGGNFDYLVMDGDETTNASLEERTLYKTADIDIMKPDDIFYGSSVDRYHYHVGDMYAMLIMPGKNIGEGYTQYYDVVNIDEYYLDKHSGKLYAVSDNQLYLMKEFTLYVGDSKYINELIQWNQQPSDIQVEEEAEDVESYVVTSDGEMNDRELSIVHYYYDSRKESYESVETSLDLLSYLSSCKEKGVEVAILFEGMRNLLSIDGYNDSVQIEIVDVMAREGRFVINEGAYSVAEDNALRVASNTDIHSKQNLVYFKWKDNLVANQVLKCGIKDVSYDANQWISNLFRHRNAILCMSFLLFILMVAGIIFVLCQSGRRVTDEEIHLRGFDRIPYGLIVAETGALVTVLIIGSAGLLEEFGEWNMSLDYLVLLEIFLTVSWSLIVAAFCMSTATRIKSKKFMQYTLWNVLMKPFRVLRESIAENKSVFWKVAWILGGLSFLEFMVIVSTTYNQGREVALFLLYKVIEVPVLLYAAMQMENLKQGGKRIASGDYSTPIDTSKMFWEFRKHGDNLNNVSEGISVAVDEKMKSERFRTELITNVSHDIKTPLTSIINYVDLLKKEEINNPQAQEYMEVLDRQSTRLKKLIEDLIEASKASTGNLPVTLEEFDANVLLTQVVGEFKERLEAKELELVVSSCEGPVRIMADGRHLWRVFDNLLGNACKYSQAGTRVYVTIAREGGEVRITFRNISNYQLNISSEELMERFVRGDRSRNTEGHGLGLNIAQSLMGLMEGTLRIDVDGDLFKVTLSFADMEGNK